MTFFPKARSQRGTFARRSGRSAGNKLAHTSGVLSRAGLLWVCLAVACATPPSTVVVTATPAVDSTRAVAARPPVDRSWSLRVREHVDLWLHGFVLVHEDSSLVPYYRPGYRQRVSAARGGVTTTLDARADDLRARLAANPSLVNAQFVALYYDSWDALYRGAAAFVRADGDARRAGDSRTAQDIATFAAYFPASADREWLEKFVEALADERTRFFGRFWRDEQRRLGPVFDRADAQWRTTYRARFARFLVNSQQREGEVLLALALAGEGRTLTVPARVNTVTVGLPTDTTAADEVLHVFAHEIVGTVAAAVVTDHTSPAQQRSGESAVLASLAAVRGGAMLLERVAPELLPGYQRSYLMWARLSAGAGDTGRAFEAAFPLPDALRDALARQIDHILGGI